MYTSEVGGRGRGWTGYLLRVGVADEKGGEEEEEWRVVGATRSRMEGRRREGKENNTKEEEEKEAAVRAHTKTRPMGPKPTFAPSQDSVPASSSCPGA